MQFRYSIFRFTVACCLALIRADTTITAVHTPQDPVRTTATLAEEEDDRTLLDIFGEVAKEYLTQKVIPDTDEACRWDWRFARCEPFCDCMLQFQWGDYHLGRSCRLRRQATSVFHNSKEEDASFIMGDDSSDCSLPPDHLYVHVMDVFFTRSEQLYHRTRQTTQTILSKTKKRMQALQEDVCHELAATTEECANKTSKSEKGEKDDDATAAPRNWKQQLLCRHIPQSEIGDHDEHIEIENAALRERVSAAVMNNSNDRNNNTAPAETLGEGSANSEVK